MAKTVGFRVPDYLLQSLSDDAKRLGIPLSEVIRLRLETGYAPTLAERRQALRQIKPEQSDAR